eukprot:Rhum_TRINITY_DN4114_c0_g1::Rhum_TRINITY_DN4114_c0_g1_i1::g.13281::m.13281
MLHRTLLVLCGVILWGTLVETGLQPGGMSLEHHLTHCSMPKYSGSFTEGMDFWDLFHGTRGFDVTVSLDPLFYKFDQLVMPDQDDIRTRAAQTDSRSQKTQTTYILGLCIASMMRTANFTHVVTADTMSFTMHLAPCRLTVQQQAAIHDVVSSYDRGEEVYYDPVVYNSFGVVLPPDVSTSRSQGRADTVPLGGAGPLGTDSVDPGRFLTERIYFSGMMSVMQKVLQLTHHASSVCVSEGLLGRTLPHRRLSDATRLAWIPPHHQAIMPMMPALVLRRRYELRTADATPAALPPYGVYSYSDGELPIEVKLPLAVHFFGARIARVATLRVVDVADATGPVEGTAARAVCAGTSRYAFTDLQSAAGAEGRYFTTVALTLSRAGVFCVCASEEDPEGVAEQVFQHVPFAHELVEPIDHFARSAAYATERQRSLVVTGVRGLGVPSGAPAGWRAVIGEGDTVSLVLRTLDPTHTATDSVPEYQLALLPPGSRSCLDERERDPNEDQAPRLVPYAEGHKATFGRKIQDSEVFRCENIQLTLEKRCPTGSALSSTESLIACSAELCARNDIHAIAEGIDHANPLFGQSGGCEVKPKLTSEPTHRACTDTKHSAANQTFYATHTDVSDGVGIPALHLDEVHILPRMPLIGSAVDFPVCVRSFFTRSGWVYLDSLSVLTVPHPAQLAALYPVQVALTSGRQTPFGSPLALRITLPPYMMFKPAFASSLPEQLRTLWTTSARDAPTWAVCAETLLHNATLAAPVLPPNQSDEVPMPPGLLDGVALLQEAFDALVHQDTLKFGRAIAELRGEAEALHLNATERRIVEVEAGKFFATQRMMYELPLNPCTGLFPPEEAPIEAAKLLLPVELMQPYWLTDDSLSRTAVNPSGEEGPFAMRVEHVAGHLHPFYLDDRQSVHIPGPVTNGKDKDAMDEKTIEESIRFVLDLLIPPPPSTDKFRPTTEECMSCINMARLTTKIVHTRYLVNPVAWSGADGNATKLIRLFVRSADRLVDIEALYSPATVAASRPATLALSGPFIDGPTVEKLLHGGICSTPVAPPSSSVLSLLNAEGQEFQRVTRVGRPGLYGVCICEEGQACSSLLPPLWGPELQESAVTAQGFVVHEGPVALRVDCFSPQDPTNVDSWNQVEIEFLKMVLPGRKCAVQVDVLMKVSNKSTGAKEEWEPYVPGMPHMVSTANESTWAGFALPHLRLVHESQFESKSEDSACATAPDARFSHDVLAIIQGQPKWQSVSFSSDIKAVGAYYVCYKFPHRQLWEKAELSLESKRVEILTPEIDALKLAQSPCLVGVDVPASQDRKGGPPVVFTNKIFYGVCGEHRDCSEKPVLRFFNAVFRNCLFLGLSLETHGDVAFDSSPANTTAGDQDVAAMWASVHGDAPLVSHAFINADINNTATSWLTFGGKGIGRTVAIHSKFLNLGSINIGESEYFYEAKTGGDVPLFVNFGRLVIKPMPREADVSSGLVPHPALPGIVTGVLVHLSCQVLCIGQAASIKFEGDANAAAALLVPHHVYILLLFTSDSSQLTVSALRLRVHTSHTRAPAQVSLLDGASLVLADGSHNFTTGVIIQELPQDSVPSDVTVNVSDGSSFVLDGASVAIDSVPLRVEGGVSNGSGSFWVTGGAILFPLKGGILSVGTHVVTHLESGILANEYTQPVHGPVVFAGRVLWNITAFTIEDTIFSYILVRRGRPSALLESQRATAVRAQLLMESVAMPRAVADSPRRTLERQHATMRTTGLRVTLSGDIELYGDTVDTQANVLSTQKPINSPLTTEQFHVPWLAYAYLNNSFPEYVKWLEDLWDDKPLDHETAVSTVANIDQAVLSAQPNGPLPVVLISSDNHRADNASIRVTGPPVSGEEGDDAWARCPRSLLMPQKVEVGRGVQMVMEGCVAFGDGGWWDPTPLYSKPMISGLSVMVFLKGVHAVEQCGSTVCDFTAEHTSTTGRGTPIVGMHVVPFGSLLVGSRVFLEAEDVVVHPLAVLEARNEVVIYGDLTVTQGAVAKIVSIRVHGLLALRGHFQVITGLLLGAGFHSLDSLTCMPIAHVYGALHMDSGRGAISCDQGIAVKMHGSHLTLFRWTDTTHSEVHHIPAIEGCVETVESEEVAVVEVMQSSTSVAAVFKMKQGRSARVKLTCGLIASAVVLAVFFAILTPVIRQHGSAVGLLQNLRSTPPVHMRLVWSEASTHVPNIFAMMAIVYEVFLMWCVAFHPAVSWPSYFSDFKDVAYEGFLLKGLRNEAYEHVLWGVVAVIALWVLIFLPFAHKTMQKRFDNWKDAVQDAAGTPAAADREAVGGGDGGGDAVNSADGRSTHTATPASPALTAEESERRNSGTSGTAQRKESNATAVSEKGWGTDTMWELTSFLQGHRRLWLTFFAVHKVLCVLSNAAMVPLLLILLAPLECTFETSKKQSVMRVAPNTRCASTDEFFYYAIIFGSGLGVVLLCKCAFTSNNSPTTPFGHPPFRNNLDIRHKRSFEALRIFLLLLQCMVLTVFYEQVFFLVCTSLSLQTMYALLTHLSYPCVHFNVNRVRIYLQMLVVNALSVALISLLYYGDEGVLCEGVGDWLSFLLLLLTLGVSGWRVFYSCRDKRGVGSLGGGSRAARWLNAFRGGSLVAFTTAEESNTLQLIAKEKAGLLRALQKQINNLRMNQFRTKTKSWTVPGSTAALSRSQSGGSKPSTSSRGATQLAVDNLGASYLSTTGRRPQAPTSPADTAATPAVTPAGRDRSPSFSSAVAGAAGSSGGTSGMLRARSMRAATVAAASSNNGSSGGGGPQTPAMTQAASGSFGAAGRADTADMESRAQIMGLKMLLHAEVEGFRVWREHYARPYYLYGVQAMACVVQDLNECGAAELDRTKGLRSAIDAGEFERALSGQVQQELMPVGITGDDDPLAYNGWVKGQLLGRGSYGSVYIAILRGGSMLAVKMIDLPSEDITLHTSELEKIQKEVEFIRKLRHPNIIQYKACFFDRRTATINIFMEYAVGGSLTVLAKKCAERLPEVMVRGYVGQVLQGLAFLHGHSVIHRDIKGENVLLDSSGCVKLADFGCAKDITGQSRKTAAKTCVGSPYWMAPEIIQNERYDHKADIWSVGCTTVEILNRGEPPWKELENLYTAMYFISHARTGPNNVPEVSELCTDFLSQCFMREWDKRPEAADLLQHSWLADSTADSEADEEQEALFREGADPNTPAFKTPLSKDLSYRKRNGSETMPDPADEPDSDALFSEPPLTDGLYDPPPGRQATGLESDLYTDPPLSREGSVLIVASPPQETPPVLHDAPPPHGTAGAPGTPPSNGVTLTLDSQQSAEFAAANPLREFQEFTK